MMPASQSASLRRHHNLSTVEVLESRIAPATFTVTNLNDSGTGSLRAALALADSHPGPDTIVFHLSAPPLHGENMITLTSGGLTSTGNVTIKGPGAGKLIINGGGKYQIFSFGGQSSSAVTITGLSMIDGAGVNGAAIFSSESLTLKNDILSGNAASGDGGAVNAASGKHLSITNSLITGNTSQGFGGGLSLYGFTTISITKSVVTGNAAQEGCGGIYAQVTGAGAGMAITGCLVSDNSAIYGGGMYLRDENSAAASKITVSGTKITGNKSTEVGERGGGGLYIREGNAVITGSTIENNSSVYLGGGIEANGFASLAITGSTISGNQATSTKGDSLQGGGGVFIEGASGSVPQPLKITGCHITDNRSDYSGGGVYALNGVALTITNSTISGNHAVGSGGGICTYGTGLGKVSLSVAGATLSGNTARYGGGIGTFPDDLSKITGPVSIISSKITGNEATNAGLFSDEGGLSINGASSLTIANCTVTGNIGSYAGGIGIYFVQSFHISGGSVTGNTGTVHAGGIGILDSTGSIIGTIISGNAAGAKGGGVYDRGGGTVTLQIAKVTGNTAPLGPDVYGTFTFV
jgi:hypothetical protein